MIGQKKCRHDGDQIGTDRNIVKKTRLLLYHKSMPLIALHHGKLSVFFPAIQKERSIPLQHFQSGVG